MFSSNRSRSAVDADSKESLERWQGVLTNALGIGDATREIAAEYDFVGILTSVMTHTEDVEILRRLKERAPGLKTILYGSTPTFMPEFTLQSPEIDFIIRREAEWALRDFRQEADVYVVNTCTVTGRSDYRSRQMLRRASGAYRSSLIVATDRSGPDLWNDLPPAWRELVRDRRIALFRVDADFRISFAKNKTPDLRPGVFGTLLDMAYAGLAQHLDGGLKA